MADMADAKEISSMAEEAKEGTIMVLPQKTIDFFNGDEMRARVFYEKYSLKDAIGKALEDTPAEMWERIAREISSVEQTPDKVKEWSDKFSWLLQEFRFIPGGRILFGTGQERRSTLLNCYVLPIREDSIEAIFDWCKEAARTYSFGGGVGGDISILRPRGTPVNNTALTSTGSTSFMEIMSETTHTIGQSGRRGALMITLDVSHPDIIDFIKIKRNLNKVRYANISVKITDEFMRAVEADTDFTLHYESAKIKRIERRVKARAIWDMLITSARDWAEPGLLFWDTIKRFSPSEYNGMEVLTTNPCSEQPLQAYGACDLGCVNLSAFVSSPFSGSAQIDWNSLETAVRYSVRFLDNVLSYNDNKHPLPEQSEVARSSRRIGLGITGLGDMFIKLKIKYDSDTALSLADTLFDRLKRIAYDESIEIAKEKGSFPAFDKTKHLQMNFVKALDEETRQKIAAYGLRNVAILTIAPTGSISVLAGTSSGIEPIFAISYTRRSESLSKSKFKVYHPLVVEYTKLSGLKEDERLPEFFIEAHQIDADFRVRMQGTIQKHIDSAISSTVNLPTETTPEQVSAIYMKAWKAGCKGITVYREGSREGILITEREEQQKLEALQKGQQLVQPQSQKNWERPQALMGKTVKMSVAQGNLYVTANFDSESVKEVFIDLGKAGSEEKSYCEALGRLISKYLQRGGDIREVVRSLKGIRSNNVIWAGGLKLYSIPDAIAKALEVATLAPGTQKEISSYGAEESTPEHDSSKSGTPNPMMSTCPSCNDHTLVNESGCLVCKACGYTKCE